MNKTSTLIPALLLAAFAGSTMAQGSMGAGEIGWQDAAAAPQAGKTRAEVRAELAQARRDGTLIAAGDAGQTPQQAQAENATVYAGIGKTRAEVKAELAQAKRNGDVLVGDSSLTLHQQFPQRYPQGVVSTPRVAQK